MACPNGACQAGGSVEGRVRKGALPGVKLESATGPGVLAWNVGLLRKSTAVSERSQDSS